MCRERAEAFTNLFRRGIEPGAVTLAPVRVHPGHDEEMAPRYRHDVHEGNDALIGIDAT